MRKVLITLLIIALLSIFGMMVIAGIHPKEAKFSISSVKEIINDNKELDKRIAELDTSVKTDYESAKSDLDKSYKNLQSSKQKYHDTITYSTEEEIQAANQTEKYEIEFLWTKIGLYATKNNLVMQANVSAGAIPGQYNISFTVLGEYISISEFINQVEADSKLGFKIEDFTLAKYSEEQLQGTFVIRNVSIDQDSLNEAISSSSNQTNNNNNDNAGEKEPVSHVNDINDIRQLNNEVHNMASSRANS